MSTATLAPDKEMVELAKSSLTYANSYFTTFSNSLNTKQSRFDNDLLYQMAILCLEKYFIALLARYDWTATHHTPLAMYKEAQDFETELTPEMKDTVIYVGKFEGICSIDGFGYRTPSKDDLLVMKNGIEEIKILIEKRLNEI